MLEQMLVEGIPAPQFARTKLSMSALALDQTTESASQYAIRGPLLPAPFDLDSAKTVNLLFCRTHLRGTNGVHSIVANHVRRPSSAIKKQDEAEIISRRNARLRRCNHRIFTFPRHEDL